MKPTLFFLFLFGKIVISYSQLPAVKYLQINSDSTYSRALLFHENNLFVGFSDGKVYQIDAKTSETKMLPKGKEMTEIRDLVVHKGFLYAMESSDSSKIYRYLLKDFSQGFVEFQGNWNQTKNHEKVFFDGMEICGKDILFIGDPNNKHELNLIKYRYSNSENYGSVKPFKSEDWSTHMFFAASGTTMLVCKKKNNTISFISGGVKSHFWKYDFKKSTLFKTQLPMQACATCGPFSHALHLKNEKNIILVGGNFLKPMNRDSVACFSKDNGESWEMSSTQPNGYRSCVHFISTKIAIACGPTGSDISFDGGKNWKSFISGEFHACVSNEEYVVMSMGNGKIVVIKKKDIIAIN